MIASPLHNPPTTDIIYPDTDGKPMANNTVQFRWLVVLEQNLEWLFAQEPEVFVAGDLFWYPVAGNNKIVNAPDVMVVFGRPKGDRGSYKQWLENNIPPQVVFEILSPSNTPREMGQKLLFYDHYGVEEYYVYAPESNDLEIWLRSEEGLEAIEGVREWRSPRLNIRFELSGPELRIYRPDGVEFLSYNEIAQQLDQTQQELEAQRHRAAQLEALLRANGIDPEQL